MYVCMQCVRMCTHVYVCVRSNIEGYTIVHIPVVIIITVHTQIISWNTHILNFFTVNILHTPAVYNGLLTISIQDV